ncbi:MAG: SET domain-containing protein [Thermomicrobiales bacterium]
MTDRRSPAKTWIDERVEVRPSPIGGMGTFARAPIAAGEVVFRWGGVLFTPEEIRAGKAKPGTVAAIDEGVYLAAPADDEGDASDFTNHSCDPNLWMTDAVTLVARRDVPADEELTGDYAMWEVDEEYVAAWACRCGSPLCRGRLTGRAWRLPELQERYRGHFSPFINRRIDALSTP